MGVSSPGRTNGVQVVQAGCQDPNQLQQLWQVHANANGSYVLQPANAANGTATNPMCLDVRGANNSDGTMIEQWTCNGGTNQEFYFYGGALPTP